MLILGADTSGKYGSIALARYEKEEMRTLEIIPLQGGTFSAQLIPQIAELLSKHGPSKTEIDAFAVVSGPGSFTGLRVGLAAIKALGEVLQKPIVAMSMLEVIAFEVMFQLLPKAGRSGAPSSIGSALIVALDAGRNQAYVGEYSAGTNFPVRFGESLLTIEELAERARESGQPIYTPDESLVQSSSRTNGSENSSFVLIARPDAGSVARLGYRKLLAGQTVTPVELDANYIRRADAEIKKPLSNPA